MGNSSGINCESCEPGKGYKGTSSPCEICVKGKYQDKDTPNEFCKDCPAGYFGKSPILCAPCRNDDEWEEADTPYQDERGKTECKQCPAGKTSEYASDNGWGCTSCVAGKRRESGLNHYGCATCSLGRYMDEIGSSDSECKKCP